MKIRFVAIVIAAGFILVASTEAAYIQGGSQGFFANPNPANSIYSGVGTNTFTWGEPLGPRPNQLSFLGAGIDVAPGTNFVVGRLTYYNAVTFFGTTTDSVDLSLTLSLSRPTPLQFSGAIRLALLSTTNSTGAPDPDADFVQITTRPAPVLTFDGVSYRFDLVGFANVGGAGSLIGSDTLRLGEEQAATVDLVGRFSAVPGAVPEPSSLALVGIGVLALLAAPLRHRAIARR